MFEGGKNELPHYEQQRYQKSAVARLFLLSLTFVCLGFDMSSVCLSRVGYGTDKNYYFTYDRVTDFG